ncbi:DUF2510 domain-containing protein [Mycobacterium sp. RTGN3]|uniref:DUF2510 domain-containing protein n=1 Tax=unclassified Mycobacterium TaxID=2642494 RepID=UPI0039AED9BC
MRVRVDDDGELRCWNCGSKGLETRRRTGSKVLGATVGFAIVGPVGVAGALAAKKRLRCRGCGLYNDVGIPEPFTGNVKAGWFPDPSGAAETLRYWDGSQWTEHTCPDPNA